MACLAMILEHRDGTAPSLHDLLDDSLNFDTYQEQPDGSIRGMFYGPFAQYAVAAHGLRARLLPSGSFVGFYAERAIAVST